MCYSARILADYRRYLRDYGAEMSLKDFVDLFWRRAADPKIRLPKAMELAFANPQGAQEAEIKTLIDRYNAEQAAKVEQELFRQRKRLADAHRSLRERSTKAAFESERIPRTRSSGRSASSQTCVARKRPTTTRGSFQCTTRR